MFSDNQSNCLKIKMLQTTLILLLVFLYFISNVNYVDSFGCSGGNLLSFSPVSPGSAPPWTSQQLPTLYQCAELCRVVGTICRTVVYIRSLSECRVYTDIISVSGGPDDVYVINSTDIPPVLAGPCGDHICPVGTRCVPKGNGYGCIQIDYFCYDPPTIAMATIANLKQAFGATTQYRCTGDGDLYLPRGSPYITCLENRNWTTTTFWCQQGWKCSHWTSQDSSLLASYGEQEVCENHGVIPRRWTMGDNSLAPGCGICFCCERI